MQLKQSQFIKKLANGLAIRIQQKFDPTSVEFFLVALNTKSQISIVPTFVEMINFKSRNFDQKCEKSNENSPESILFQIPNSVSACKIECLQKIGNKKCGCILAFPYQFINKNFEGKICNLNQTFNCFYPKLIEPNSNSERDFCYQNCLDPCDSWNFQNFLNSIPLDVMVLENYSNANELNSVSYDYVIMDIYFGDLQHVVITQAIIQIF